jgi:hypothetical protein
MSRQNKANKTNYMQAGRLSPDDMARERQKQATATPRGAARRTVLALPKLQRRRKPKGEGGPVAPKPKGEGGPVAPKPKGEGG